MIESCGAGARSGFRGPAPPVRSAASLGENEHHVVSLGYRNIHHGERVLQNLNLSVAEMDDLLSFLDTLEEELPAEALRKPLPR